MPSPHPKPQSALKIAVLLPCYNEAHAIGAVVKRFRTHLPAAEIFVFDNNSTDQTVAEAKAAGALVHVEKKQGKGNVVRRMFSDIDADVYVMCDGDGTYEIEAVGKMIALFLEEKCDMLVGTRKGKAAENMRRGHRLGNNLFNTIIGLLFGKQFKDVFSGYRIFSRAFVKSFPSLSSGFEIETEFTVHALELMLPVAEIPTEYNQRIEGSSSKLRTYTDGTRILLYLILLFKELKPFRFFLIIAAMFAVVSIFLMIPIFETYVQTGLVPRFPTAILAACMMLVAFTNVACGTILDSISRGRWEVKRLAYLSLRSGR